MEKSDFELIEKAINATLAASNAHMKDVKVGKKQLSDLFVVEIFVGSPSSDLGYVCDHFGTIDGPYSLVDAKTIVHNENRKE